MMKLFIPIFLLVTALFSEDNIPKEDCIPKEEIINVWYRLAPSNSDSLEVISLNMSYGFIWADPLNVHILVFDNNTGEKILMTFSNGAWFDANAAVWEKNDKYTPKNKEGPMKKTKDKGIKIEKRYN